MGKITENGLKILKEKAYFRQDETTWEDICMRVSKTISKAETNKKKQNQVFKDIYNAMASMKFIFSSPCLINADPEKPGQYSSCFIIDLEDNIESIFDAAAKMAKIFQKSGGAGVANISVLRPSNSRVEESNGYSCGPLYFMKVYNEVADAMTTANKSKRGALKINMDCWHPNIIDFINLKVNAKETEFNLMNISVSLSDEFMLAVQNDDNWNLEFPDYENIDKEIYNNEWRGDLDDWKSKGYPIRVYNTIKARELKRIIDEGAWKIGDPGFNYQDTMNRANKNKHLGLRIFTNPCNEFSNLPWTSCNLGSINLVEFVEGKTFNMRGFSDYVNKAVRWLDNMISVNKLPLPKIQEMTDDIRPIGLGIMGFGTALYKLGIKYGNNVECIDFIQALMTAMQCYSIKSSTELAIEKGEYPKWEGSEWYNQGIKIRNSNLLSIAPNGTLSALCGVSGGIEPEFGLVYYRRTNNGNIYFYTNPIFEEELRNRGLYSEELLKKVADNHGSCVGIKEIPQDMQDVFVTAHDISPEEHVYVVAEFQKFVDLSISKTINFPNSATVEDISNIIELGWKTGCKGLTVYRDGCRSLQTLSTSTPQETKKEEVSVVVKKSRKDFGKMLKGNTYSAESGCGTFYFTLNRNPEDGKIIETFVNIKQGLCKSNVDALNRMVSLSLRRDIPMEDVIDQLKGITCSACQNAKYRGKGLDGLSCPDIMARVLQSELQLSRQDDKVITMDSSSKPGKSVITTIDPSTNRVVSAINEDDYNNKIDKALQKNLCPECEAKLDHVSGCIQCNNCGWSKC